MPVMEFGGVESIVAVLAERLPREQFDFRVCTFWKDGDAADRVRRAGIPCDCLGVDPRLRNPAAISALTRYLRKVRPQLLHASISEANFHACIASLLFPRMRLILEEVGTPERSTKARVLFGLAYRRANALIGVSKATARYLAEEEFAPKDRIHQIYNCVDGRFLEEAPGERPPAYEKFRVGMVGRLVAEKNHKRLLQAWSRVADEEPDAVELHIVGDGPLRDELERTIATMPHGDTVTLHGFRNDVASFLKSLDAVVLPSVREGYGIALVEAMAQSVPVIGSTAGGVPEVLDGYGDEWIIDPHDVAGWSNGIKRLMNLSPAQRKELGERGRKLAIDRFSPASYVEAIANLYHDQLAKR
jgi:glycosyltransferase involved in cell wall biosynthesis